MVRVAPYLMFYEGQPTATDVRVIRVIHERRKITARFIDKGR